VLYFPISLQIMEWQTICWTGLQTAKRGQLRYIFSSEYHNRRGWVQANVKSVRFQVCRLMRCLVQLCNTLEQIPDEVKLSTAMLHSTFDPQANSFCFKGMCPPPLIPFFEVLCSPF